MGGAERVAAEVANEMCRRGHAVAIYSDAAPGATSSYPLDSRILHIKMPSAFVNAETICKAISDFGPDAGFIFYYNTKSLFFPFWLMRQLSLPIGIQECTNPTRALRQIGHEISGNLSVEGQTLRAIFLSGAGRIRFTLDSYVASAPHSVRDRVRAFPNAFAIQERTNLCPDGKKAIISVGGLKAINKNGIALLRAFSLIASEFPDWNVRVYGKVGRNLEGDVSPFREHPQIVFGGETDQIHSAYGASQIHVICSLQEGCPNTVCEAMSHGVPSIGFSDCPGTNELIRHNDNGLLIGRETETKSLAEALATLMRDDGMRERLGAKAHEHARALFSPSVIYDKWEKMLVELANDCGPKIADNDEAISRVLEEYRSPLVQAQHITGKVIPPANMPLVSFIVPLFNKEQFIEETLLSIDGNGYQNIELIVVDDASTDRSMDIVERFCVSRRRFPIKIVRHDVNRGLSASRNTGLSVANGKYIQFWDADDVYGKKLRKLITEMEEDKADFGTGIATRDGVVLPWYKPSLIHRRATTFGACRRSFAASSTCFKVYRKDFLEKHSLQFVEGLYLQDTEFNLRAFPLASSITVTPRALGEYRRVDESGSKTLTLERLESSLRIEALSRDFYGSNGFDRFEDFRQAKVITFTFQNFVRKLLMMTTTGHKGSEQSVSVSLSDADAFLNRYASALKNMKRGLKLIAKTDPHRALAYIALSARNDNDALHLITSSRQGKLKFGLRGRLARNPIGFSWSEIDKILDSISAQRIVADQGQRADKAPV
jgi:glycosyltransferase involved in cell wall biosynthesis